MKKYEYRWKFYWNLFPKYNYSNSQYSNIGSDNDLAPTRRQAIIWTTDVYMRQSASIS